MIKLDVQPYCHECAGFMPFCDRSVEYESEGRVYYRSDTVITCKYKKRCEQMIKYLEKHKDKH